LALLELVAVLVVERLPLLAVVAALPAPGAHLHCYYSPIQITDSSSLWQNFEAVSLFDWRRLWKQTKAS
jgi:hypothetical protein